MLESQQTAFPQCTAACRGEKGRKISISKLREFKQEAGVPGEEAPPPADGMEAMEEQTEQHHSQDGDSVGRGCELMRG